MLPSNSIVFQIGSDYIHIALSETTVLNINLYFLVDLNSADQLSRTCQFWHVVFKDQNARLIYLKLSMWITNYRFDFRRTGIIQRLFVYSLSYMFWTFLNKKFCLENMKLKKLFVLFVPNKLKVELFFLAMIGYLPRVSYPIDFLNL